MIRVSFHRPTAGEAKSVQDAHYPDALRAVNEALHKATRAAAAVPGHPDRDRLAAMAKETDKMVDALPAGGAR